ncbi:hypothetical protein WR25_19058 [Diploscapter pachys]|uniref:Uncharacterized protein n=1 Tax=Diploscapter pachys TaxID=2018661 RepID=A0A2A2KG83_9BILA|nr:hypothetical protein WR25_19058 [Diploscapter pachys]
MLYTRGRTDMAAYTAARPAASAPGTQFVYSSGDSNLLAASLRAMLAPERYADYPWQALFMPLGIDSARDGRWREQQLLPAEWVAFNRTLFSAAQPVPGEANPGGHWWLNQPLPGQPVPWPDAPSNTGCWTPWPGRAHEAGGAPAVIGRVCLGLARAPGVGGLPGHPFGLLGERVLLVPVRDGFP